MAPAQAGTAAMLPSEATALTLAADAAQPRADGSVSGCQLREAQHTPAGAQPLRRHRATPPRCRSTAYARALRMTPSTWICWLFYCCWWAGAGTVKVCASTAGQVDKCDRSRLISVTVCASHQISKKLHQDISHTQCPDPHMDMSQQQLTAAQTHAPRTLTQ